MSYARLAVLFSTFFLASGIQASPNTDALGQCFSDSTNGRDRKDLAKWIYVSMSAHPEIGVSGKPGAKEIEVVQRTMANLFTRLVAEQCSSQMNAVVQSEGMEGVKLAFEYLGRIAMQELMSNPEVTASINGFTRYIDKEKIERTIKSK
ncbi:MAG: hypothetical protein JNL84_05980 [Candidatus Accumulibacter sp.]|nr:hypothetical protein [Accumulibacter sp.]